MVRSPAEALRLGLALAAAALIVVAVRTGRSALAGAERDLLRLTSQIPEPLAALFVRTVQYAAVLAPLVGLVVLVATRSFRRLAAIIVAGFLGGVAGRWIMVDLLDLTVGRFRVSDTFRDGIPFPNAAFLAGMAAIVAADSPWMGRRWRAVARIWITILLGLRLISGATGLRELIVASAVGWAMGTAVVALLGAPDRRPADASVHRALVRLGVSVGSIAHRGAHRGRHLFDVTTTSDVRLRVEVAARDGWQTMLPGRLYRALRFRDPADGQPFASLRELVEHEALVTLKARGDGVPTLELEAIGEVDPNGYLLAFHRSDSRPLSERPDLDERVLPELWGLVVRMRTARIAHRQLEQDAVLVDDADDRLRVIEFSASDLTGDERVLAGDIAEVLAWGSRRFGVEPTVLSAVAAFGPGVVGRTLPRLQPLALTPATRAAIDDELLASIRDAVRSHTGSEDAALAPIERIKPRAVVTAIMAVVALNALVPQLAGAGKVWAELKDASIAAIIAVLVLSMVTYLGAAISLSGSVAEPLPFGPNLAVQVAASFAAIAAPAQVGGMALRGRFLQRRGIDPAVSVAAIGLNTVGSFAVHVTITAAFAWWAGSSDFGKIELPSSRALLLAGGAVAIAIVAVGVVPAGRRFVRGTLVPAVRRSAQGVVDVARRPVRLLGLIGGAAIVTLGYVGAMVLSVDAFHGGLPVSAVAIVYLLGAIVQSAAPTPGGLGAAEAAYIGGLTAVGLHSEQAVAAVLLFRLATFWLPVLPGWAAMLWLQRSDAI
ncbi:MAG: flippase-like domain-containing protein [Actinobacteria bacterium]|nr:flippase-like domain-containing protein [Actinomycetota bacterium]